MSDQASEQGCPTILVVDDSPEMQRYLRLLLELESYTVWTVGSGEDALQCMRDGLNPAVVLLDLRLPGIDGLRTLRRLRKMRPGLPVIICSGEEKSSKARLALALGAQAFLQKPVQQLYLSAAIQRCLGDVEEAPPRTEIGANVITLPRPNAFL